MGSGQTKLFMAAKASELGNYWGAWFAPAVGLLAIILAIFVGFQTWREFGTDTLYGTLFVVLAGLGLFGLGIAKAEGSRPSEAQSASGASDGWLDLYASHDPGAERPDVPPCRPTRVLTSRQVRNRASTLHDHTAYARNVEQVIAVIAETAAAASHRELSEHPQEAAGDRAVAALRRNWRVGWLRAAKWVAVAGGLAIAVRTWITDETAGPEVMGPIVTALEKMLSVDVPSTWTQGEEATAAAAIAFGGATTAVGYPPSPPSALGGRRVTVTTCMNGLKRPSGVSTGIPCGRRDTWHCWKRSPASH